MRNGSSPVGRQIGILEVLRHHPMGVEHRWDGDRGATNPMQPSHWQPGLVPLVVRGHDLRFQQRVEFIRIALIAVLRAPPACRLPPPREM